MLKIYDEFLEDETILSLKHMAYRVHVSALIYCSRNLTDGQITERSLKVLQVILGFNVRRQVAELVASGLWIPQTDGGWQIRNYLDFNPSSDIVKKERKAARERMRQLRKKRVDSPEGSQERSPEHAGERSPAVPSPAFAQPSGVNDLSAPTSYEGREETWKRLVIATGARSRPDIGKLERTIVTNRCIERDLVCAIEAATGPGVRDPLAVALSELKKRADERRAA